MREEIKSLYIKRSQKDYPMSFKLSVGRQNKFLEQQIVDATDKAGILDKIIEIAEEDFKITPKIDADTV
ncbi:MAG: hypothetical protein RSF01_06000 [Bacteroidales bacterium]